MNEAWLIPSLLSLALTGVAVFLPKIALRSFRAYDFVIYHALFFFGSSTLVQLFTGGFVFDMRGAVIAALSGAFGTVGQLLYLSALQRGPLSLVSVISSLYPLVATALAVVFLHEPLGVRQGLGIVLGILSIILVVGFAGKESAVENPADPPRKTSGLHWIFPALGALLVWGIWSFIPKLAVESLPPVTALFYAGIGDIAIVALVYIFLLHGKLDKNRRGISVTAISSFLAMAATLAYFYAISTGPVSTVSTLTAMYPVITVLLACVFLRERLNRRQVAAIALTAVSIALLAG